MKCPKCSMLKIMVRFMLLARAPHQILPKKFVTNVKIESLSRPLN